MPSLGGSTEGYVGSEIKDGVQYLLRFILSGMLVISFLRFILSGLVVISLLLPFKRTLFFMNTSTDLC